jgi:ABC-2 type transport system permease protein
MIVATDAALRSQPQRGRVFPAWAFIGWRWVWRSPAAAVVPLLQPFFFLYFLSMITDPRLFPLQVAGAMLFSTQNIGSWCLADSAVFRIELRLQDIFVASPHDKLRYLFGVAFSNLIPALPAILLLGVILEMLTPVSWVGWLVLAACILTIWILYAAIGIAVSSRLRSQREIWPVGNLIFTLLGILSPLYYPISFLPPVWREFARILPATYAALLVQGALGFASASTEDLGLDAGLLVLSTVVGLMVAWSLYRWRES